MFQAEYRSSFHSAMKRKLAGIKDTQAAIDAMQTIGENLILDNINERYREANAQGRRMAKWRVRKGVYKFADGPTLAPFGLDSRVIDWFGYDITQTNRGRAHQQFVLSVGWIDHGKHHRDKGRLQGLDVLRAHAGGMATKRGWIIRDVFGMTPLMRRTVARSLRMHRDNRGRDFRR